MSNTWLVVASRFTALFAAAPADLLPVPGVFAPDFRLLPPIALAARLLARDLLVRQKLDDGKNNV